MRPAVVAFAIVAVAAGCNGGLDPDGPDVDAGVEDDPLLVTDAPAPGSLDELHANIIKPRCSGQPGLCHNGQFEPNFATPALTYAYLVRRPGIEKADRVRVDPGHPESSLLVDKLRYRNGVATQMPLGAEPLAEADIAAVEAWITAGALRAPGDAEAPILNNPPRAPEIGVFSSAGTRLDATGSANVSPGQTIALRHTVQDFETADAAIPFAAVLLIAADGRTVVLDPAAANPGVGITSYDAGGPPALGDVFDFRRDWSIGATIELYDESTGDRETVTAVGQTLMPVAAYYDDAGTYGIAAYAFSTRSIRIQ
jgi:hypothetical protein